jgi:hypothetical protein
MAMDDVRLSWRIAPHRLTLPVRGHAVFFGGMSISQPVIRRGTKAPDRHSTHTKDTP